MMGSEDSTTFLTNADVFFNSLIGTQIATRTPFRLLPRFILHKRKYEIKGYERAIDFARPYAEIFLPFSIVGNVPQLWYIAYN